MQKRAANLKSSLAQVKDDALVGALRTYKTGRAILEQCAGRLEWLEKLQVAEKTLGEAVAQLRTTHCPAALE
eukprot:3239928-Alexandrium_andersonii.AAC.1